jgi:hypothetical protein
MKHDDIFLELEVWDFQAMMLKDEEARTDVEGYEEIRVGPETDVDWRIVALFKRFLKTIALEEPIPGEDWSRLRDLAYGVVQRKGLFLLNRGNSNRAFKGNIPAGKMRYKPTFLDFFPETRADGTTTYTKIQTALSKTFLRSAAFMAWNILELVDEIPAVGRAPFGVCRNCGEFFMMSYKGKVKKFCSARCRSLIRSKKPSM